MPELTDFLGRWKLSRRIDDRMTGMRATAEGEAEWRPAAGGTSSDRLIYHERTKLSLPGQTVMKAERTYIWQDGGGGRIVVTFEDGRPFHGFRIGDVLPAASHDCQPDFYHVTYDFSHWPDWEAAWTVRGPRKNYVSVSLYSPEGRA